LIELILLCFAIGTIGPPTDAKEMKMKRSLLSRFILLALGVLAVLAGCSAGSGSRFAAHDTTVEYYRVFDIRTDAAPQAIATAAIFTKPEGGWLSWPRQVGGMMMGTPEKFTENTMLDIVRAIPTSTRAQVSLVEAKPNLPGTPWLEGGEVPHGTQASKP
jgi:hypothetical protein